MVPHVEPEKLPPCAVFMREHLVTGMETWVKFYQFVYEGELLEYALTSGANYLTARQAEDVAHSAGLRKMAYGKFLRDVDLETRH